VLALGLITLLAWLMARSALYTITNRRVVMRFGIALPMSVNLPFTVIDGVDLRAHGGDAGDIAIRPEMNRRLSYIVMWPHVRPWRFSPLQPMMRCLDDAAGAAEILGAAIAAANGIARAPARSAARAPEGRRGETDGGRPFPLPPLVGAATLIGIVVASVAWLQLTTEPAIDDPSADAVQSIALRFVDRDDGAVVVIDAGSDAVIDVLEPGTNNFLRATLRGLVRSRHAIGDLSKKPFRLSLIADGRLLLTDPVTSRHADLWAFGETNALAFKRFLGFRPDAATTSAVAIGDISASNDIQQHQEELQ
jgi:putative photosynthetic complex assembly protein